MKIRTMRQTDYMYCEDCEMFVDIFLYDHSIEEAGHGGCVWRYATPEELAACVRDCEAYGCFEPN